MFIKESKRGQGPFLTALGDVNNYFEHLGQLCMLVGQVCSTQPCRVSFAAVRFYKQKEPQKWQI